jgi:hypothetical protein
MNYRIKQVGNKYYPQYKFLWLFWLNFKSGMHGIGYYNTVFWSLEEATGFIRNLNSNKSVDNSITIHKY